MSTIAELKEEIEDSNLADNAKAELADILNGCLSANEPEHGYKDSDCQCKECRAKNRKMTQEQAVETLERNGYTWKYTSDEFDFIVLARKIDAGMIQQVEVDEDGLCNGLLLHDYLKEVTYDASREN